MDIRCALLLLAAIGLTDETPPLFLELVVPLDERPLELHVGPVDAGDVPDVFVVTETLAPHDQGTLRVLAGSGSGDFSEIWSTIENAGDGFFAFRSRLVDMDADGSLDLAVANVRNAVKSWLNDDTGQLDPAGLTGFIGGSMDDVAFTDLNGDVFPDMCILLCDFGIWLCYGTGDGDGTFTGITFGDSPMPFCLPAKLELADLDGDGFDDAIVACERGLAVAPNLPGGGWPFNQGTPDPLLEVPLLGLAVDDLEPDGDVDIIATAPRSDAVYVLRNTGDGTFDAPQVLAAGRRPEAVATGDFDGDGRRDLAVATTGGSSLDLFFGTRDGLRGPHTVPLGAPPSALGVADLDLDGDDDVVAASQADASLSVLLNQRIP